MERALYTKVVEIGATFSLWDLILDGTLAWVSLCMSDSWQVLLSDLLG